MTDLSEWDDRWMGYYECAREDGETPSEAIATATEQTEQTEAKHGPRPVEEL